MLRSLVFHAALVVVTFALSFIAVPVAFVTRNTRASQGIARLWARILLFAGGVRVEIEGLDRINPQEAYVFAANHQSQFDIFALLGYLPVQFRWLAKQELFRIPVFGAAMRGAGYIPIDRRDGRAAFRSIDQAAARVREGASIVIFPEGTRSTDGKLKFFKKGGFFLAIKSGRPIVPVSITGSYNISAKGSFRIRPGTIRIRVGEPVPTESLATTDKDWLISQIRRRIQEHLPPEERGVAEPAVADSPPSLERQWQSTRKPCRN